MAASDSRPPLATSGDDGTAGCRIDLGPTLRLAQETAERVRTDPRRAVRALAAADDRLRQRDRSFGGVKNLSAALSALLLDEGAVAALARTAERLHRIVDRVLDSILSSDARRGRLGRDYQRLFPYLRKTPGWPQWQILSRYDAVVTADGRVRIIELNTGCPAGFMHAEAFARATAAGLAELGAFSSHAAEPATIDPRALVDGLLEVERASGIEPATVALATDENQLTHELDLIEEELVRRGRVARTVDARRLRFDGERLRDGSEAISAAYHKFRISIPSSRNHCWRDGFEARYADLLSAMNAGAFAFVNNLAAQTIGEDKSMLQWLRLAEAASILSEEDRRFVAENVLWTHRLEGGTVGRNGETIDLLPYVTEHRDQFVIKPTSEGRGYAVAIGRDTDEETWRRLCTPDPSMPCVVQDYVEPCRLSVVFSGADGPQESEMFLTLGLATVCGRYRGVLSRVSPSRVTNVAREGFVQGVLRR